MMSAQARTLVGEVDLAVPADLFDIPTPSDADEARTVFNDLFGRMFPRMGAADRSTMVAGILSWREQLLADGCVLHGLVAVPKGPNVEAAAHWHIMAGVVDVPTSGVVDVAVLGTRFFGSQFSEDRAYTESFDTDMGWGVGVITEVPLTMPTAEAGLQPADSDAAAMLPPVLGMATALSAARDSDRGLLVIGMCLDVAQTLEMAAIVAVIASKSQIRSDPVRSDPGRSGE